MMHLFPNRKILTALSDRQLSLAIAVLLFSIIGFVVPWWWSITLVAAVLGYFETSSVRAILLSTIGCFMSWLLMTVAFDAMNGFRISMRLGGLVGLPIPIAASLFAAAVGGLVAGLAAAASYQLKLSIVQLKTANKN